MKQFVVTPSAGKRLIAKAVLAHPAVEETLTKGTLVIVAGTTNGYVAQEILESTRQAEGFSRKGFRRGLVLPPGFDPSSVRAPTPSDVVLVDGVWQKGKTIFDVADSLSASDVIIKGANAVDVTRSQAALLIADAQAGTAGAVLRAVYGRRVRVIIPVGLEKRVSDDVTDLAAEMNDPAMEGPRLMPLPGQVITELDAIPMLTGAVARLVAGGGLYGAEGAVWLAISGNDAQLQLVVSLMVAVAAEPPCQA